MDDKIKRMKELIPLLSEAAKAYYQESRCNASHNYTYDFSYRFFLFHFLVSFRFLKLHKALYVKRVITDAVITLFQPVILLQILYPEAADKE